ncbi:PerC family transcriptional regulator, partial [Escherichia coli]
MNNSTLKSRTISDATAEELESRGLWRRAARRWQDVMITLEKDSHRQLAVMRARECIRKAKRPIPESRIDIHTVRKAADRTIQKMGLPSLTDEIWR